MRRLASLPPCTDPGDLRACRAPATAPLRHARLQRRPGLLLVVPFKVALHRRPRLRRQQSPLLFVVGDRGLVREVLRVLAEGGRQGRARRRARGRRPRPRPDGALETWWRGELVRRRSLALLPRRLLQEEQDVNALDQTGQRALHWSSVRGHLQVAELLLKEGAKVAAADLYGYQALDKMVLAI